MPLPALRAGDRRADRRAQAAQDETRRRFGQRGPRKGGRDRRSGKGLRRGPHPRGPGCDRPGAPAAGPSPVANPERPYHPAHLRLLPPAPDPGSHRLHRRAEPPALLRGTPPPERRRFRDRLPPGGQPGVTAQRIRKAPHRYKTRPHGSRFGFRADEFCFLI